MFETVGTQEAFWDFELFEYSLFKTNELLGISLEAASRHGTDTFQILALNIYRDILDTKEALTLKNQKLLDFIQFIHCTEAARFYNQKGLFQYSHDWLIFSLTDSETYGNVTEFESNRLSQFLESSEDFLKANSVMTILEWGEVLFYYSRKHGGLVELAKGVQLQLYKLAKYFLGKNSIPEIVENQCIATLSQLMSWSTTHDHACAKLSSQILENRFQLTNNAKAQKLIAVQLGVSSNTFLAAPLKNWIEIALQFTEDMGAHERMQVLARYYSAKPELLYEEWHTFESAIDDYLEFLEEIGGIEGIELKYEKSRLFDTITPLIVALLLHGETEILAKVICRYYKISNEARITGKLLFILSALDSTILYVKENDTKRFEQKIPESFKKIIEITNRFLSTKISINNTESFNLIEPEVLGKPVIELGLEFEQALNEHYCLPQADISVLANCQGLILLPGLQHPIQSLLIKNIGDTIPISCSLETPLPKRDIRKIFLWCFGTRTSDLELALLQAIFSNKGIQTEVLNVLEHSREYFFEIYNDPSIDLIWVGTHGNFEHLAPHKSNIDAHQDGPIIISELQNLVPERESQRLIFLNICDGATAMSASALYDLGIGASICNRFQAVISHLWMVDIAASFVYGIIYAHYISEGQDFFTAYKNTTIAFLNGKDFISETLSPYYYLSFDNLENDHSLETYVNSLPNEISENIYYWGSGVYYE